MSNQASNIQLEREYTRFRELHQAVLLHLMTVGPTKWDVLSGHFDQERTGEVTHALRHLARLKHITVEADSTAKITASGMRQLRREN